MKHRTTVDDCVCVRESEREILCLITADAMRRTGPKNMLKNALVIGI